MVQEYPRWLSTQQLVTEESNITPIKPELADDDQILWTMNPDYDGRAINDWQNFRMMTVREAREQYKYGQVELNWLPTEQHDIRAKLINAGVIPRKKRLVVV